MAVSDIGSFSASPSLATSRKRVASVVLDGVDNLVGAGREGVADDGLSPVGGRWHGWCPLGSCVGRKTKSRPNGRLSIAAFPVLGRRDYAVSRPRELNRSTLLDSFRTTGDPCF